MEKIIIKGGKELAGELTVSGSKNAVLPIIVATILAEDKCVLQDAPDLADVRTINEVLTQLGAKVKYFAGEIEIDASRITSTEATPEQVRKMRASFLLLGPLLARYGKARISLPGGCAIGTRPIDLHLKGLAALGAKIAIGHGVVEATASKLTGAKVYLDFPSVGATENIMMAGALAEGMTIIENAAEEPEIVDLANFLNHMGAKVWGAGTNIIKIEGVKSLQGAQHTIIPDRIEAGTFMVLAAAAKGNILIKNAIIDHLKPVVAKLNEMGVEITEDLEGIRVKSPERFEAVDIKTLPYPGFPTDMQAQMMALSTVANGTSVITETVFENRFMHVDELKRMGARIIIEGHSAIVKGVNKLTGAPVKATDLRAGAAMIISALMADGTTEIGGLHHIDRGYEHIVEKLQNIGADIERVQSDEVAECACGC